MCSKTINSLICMYNVVYFSEPGWDGSGRGAHQVGIAVPLQWEPASWKWSCYNCWREAGAEHPPSLRRDEWLPHISEGLLWSWKSHARRHDGPSHKHFQPRKTYVPVSRYFRSSVNSFVHTGQSFFFQIFDPHHFDWWVVQLFYQLYFGQGQCRPWTDVRNWPILPESEMFEFVTCWDKSSTARKSDLSPLHGSVSIFA